ncbi:7TM diverse intracellular signaling domain-containing protein [Pedobacter frigoris]|uniref:7TM diverse intracellular signaling domain-containing protein n=1 Tax=Pedobacter frigoris TaxID=2571272 RepID=UPI00292E14DF|nr:7TM diverse intracellular signaling domain-containing protein [Pedobacter frigoris]
MNKNLVRLYLLILAFIMPFIANAQVKKSGDSLINILHNSDIYVPGNDLVSVNQVIDKTNEFKKLGSGLINLGNYKHGVWIRAILPQGTDTKKYTELLIDQSRIREAEVFFVANKKIISQTKYTNYGIITSSYQIGNLNTFKIPETYDNSNAAIYIKLSTDEVVMTPIFIGSTQKISNIFSIRDVFFGIYTGIMLIMFAYNLFLYFSIKDTSYLNYIFCILFTWITQTTLQGYFTKYFPVELPVFNEISVVLFSNLGLIASIMFTKSFLNTKKNSPKNNTLFNIILLFTTVNTILLFFGSRNLSFIGMQISIVASSIIAFIAAFNTYFKVHFKPAGYYLVSWTFLFIGMMIFILKDYEVIGYSLFTTYAAQFASVLEVLLLSFALADRINFFKAENEQYQKQALKISMENEELIREQNIVLEKRVNERTLELQDANSTLSVTLNNLKSAQSQLVDQEKMAGLGQLTAGIAHEINNPINFVTSNIKPLELDINDLNEVIHMYEKLDLNDDIQKQISSIESFKKRIDIDFVRDEIKSLLAGIGEGAKRTAEIIRSLKNFSRLDENDTKPVNIAEGLDSTLVLIRSTFPSNLKIVKDYQSVPEVECMPGKINQVFMNLITNAIQAIKSKSNPDEEEYLYIKTWQEGTNVKISIRDSGTGMPDEVKQKIFEPFFTTKDVGEGTGLGLSIVFRIIENHHGSIDVVTKLNQGTEFIITLPVN